MTDKEETRKPCAPIEIAYSSYRLGHADKIKHKSFIDGLTYCFVNSYKITNANSALYKFNRAILGILMISCISSKINYTYFDLQIILNNCNLAIESGYISYIRILLDF